LVALLEINGQNLPAELAELDYLTPFATAFRYEDAPTDMTFDRSKTLELVRRIRAFVLSQIGDGGDTTDNNADQH